LGLLIIWTNAFLFAQTINVLTLQFIFMLILGSFCLLGARFGVLYAIASTMPVILHLLSGQHIRIPGIAPNELASPGYEIIVVLNFVTIVTAHYLFLQAFISTIKEKDVLNKQLQTAAEEAIRAAQSKTEFLSTMTHELRTPLNSVIGISELLLLDTHSQEQNDSLRILKFSAVNLYSLINNILDFNKLGIDKLDLDFIPVRLDDLVQDTCLGLRFQAEQKGIGFFLEMDEAIRGRQIITDPTRITQLIYNLAGNAIKFTEKGRVSVRLEVLCEELEEMQIRFSVQDTGIGIRADQKEAIFDSFSQASASIARNFGGTGLGLSIVKRLLILFNSRIQLESTPGSGSLFWFDITVKLQQGQLDVPPESQEPDYNLAGLKILVAEDNQMNRLLLLKILSRWNNKPDFALNGQEAVDMVRVNEYDVLLMDLHMPVLDGYGASKAIRAMADPLKSKLQIIALTASVSDNLSRKIREAGMDDYLPKPFKIKELYQKLQLVVG
jgi:signal transduction histidine kinase